MKYRTRIPIILVFIIMFFISCSGGGCSSNTGSGQNDTTSSYLDIAQTSWNSIGGLSPTAAINYYLFAGDETNLDIIKEAFSETNIEKLKALIGGDFSSSKYIINIAVDSANNALYCLINDASYSSTFPTGSIYFYQGDVWELFSDRKTTSIAFQNSILY